jgi:ABC-type sulfate transport system substrate-binding protein
MLLLLALLDLVVVAVLKQQGEWVLLDKDLTVAQAAQVTAQAPVAAALEGLAATVAQINQVTEAQVVLD